MNPIKFTSQYKTPYKAQYISQYFIFLLLLSSSIWTSSFSLNKTISDKSGTENNPILHKGQISAKQDTQAVHLTQLLLKQISNNQYIACQKYFSDTVKQALTPKRLQETWETLESQVGKLAKSEKAKLYHLDSNSIYVVIPCKFEHLWLNFSLTFNTKLLVTGMHFDPPQSKSNYQNPPYGDESHVTEIPLVIGNKPYLLKGILTLPKAGEHFPVIILVHGSGPHDMDETIGNNKPFKDLALGLAELGIATFRYDKRTHAYGTKLATIKDSITIDNEVTEDACAAIQSISNIKDIDSNRIYLLGHSLGGMIAPRIAERSTQLAGIIVMAGNSRPLQEVVKDQFDYLLGPNSKSADAKTLRLGLSDGYWASFDAYNQTQTAQKLNCKQLYLQGEADYQVTMKDFNGWKTALSSKPTVSFQSFPKLTHLMTAITREGLSLPSDYEKDGHVDLIVIQTIKNWIK